MVVKFRKSQEHEAILNHLRQKQAYLSGNLAQVRESVRLAEAALAKIDAQVVAAEEEAEAIKIRDLMFPPEAQERTVAIVRQQMSNPILRSPTPGE